MQIISLSSICKWSLMTYCTIYALNTNDWEAKVGHLRHRTFQNNPMEIQIESWARWSTAQEQRYGFPFWSVRQLDLFLARSVLCEYWPANRSTTRSQQKQDRQWFESTVGVYRNIFNVATFQEATGLMTATHQYSEQAQKYVFLSPTTCVLKKDTSLSNIMSLTNCILYLSML